jgi:hypothetical protein
VRSRATAAVRSTGLFRATEVVARCKSDDWKLEAEREAQQGKGVQSTKGGQSRARVQASLAQGKAEAAMAGLLQPAAPTAAEREQTLTRQLDRQIEQLAALRPEAMAPSSFFSHNDGSAARKFNAIRSRAESTRRELTALRESGGEDHRAPPPELPPPLP